MQLRCQHQNARSFNRDHAEMRSICSIPHLARADFARPIQFVEVETLSRQEAHPFYPLAAQGHAAGGLAANQAWSPTTHPGLRAKQEARLSRRKCLLKT